MLPCFVFQVFLFWWHAFFFSFLLSKRWEDRGNMGTRSIGKIKHGNTKKIKTRAAQLGLSRNKHSSGQDEWPLQETSQERFYCGEKKKKMEVTKALRISGAPTTWEKKRKKKKQSCCDDVMCAVRYNISATAKRVDSLEFEEKKNTNIQLLRLIC